jgi:hypothetical protein
MNIDVDRDELLEVLEKNRNAHKGAFDLAFERFRKEAIEWFKGRLDSLNKGELPSTWFNLPIPEDHTSDYNRLIDMVGMHKMSTLNITMREYQNYVDDEWPWTANETTTNTYYSVDKSKF